MSSIERTVCLLKKHRDRLSQTDWRLEDEAKTQVHLPLLCRLHSSSVIRRHGYETDNKKPAKDDGTITQLRPKNYSLQYWKFWSLVSNHQIPLQKLPLAEGSGLTHVYMYSLGTSHSQYLATYEFRGMGSGFL